MSQFTLVDSPKMMAYLKEIFCGDDPVAGLLWLLSRPSSLGVQTLYEMIVYLREAFNPKYVSGPSYDRLSLTSLIRGTCCISDDKAKERSIDDSLDISDRSESSTSSLS